MSQAVKSKRLKHMPTPRQIGNPTGHLPAENAEALPAKEPRTYHYSGLIRQNTGFLLEDLQLILQRKENRRSISKAEIIERGIELLFRKTKNAET